MKRVHVDTPMRARELATAPLLGCFFSRLDGDEEGAARDCCCSCSSTLRAESEAATEEADIRKRGEIVLFFYSESARVNISMRKACLHFFFGSKGGATSDCALEGDCSSSPMNMRTPPPAEEQAVPSFTCGICYSEDVVEAGCLDSCEHA